MRPCFFFLEKQDAFAYFKVAACSHQSIVQVQWVSSSMFRSMPFVQKCEFFSVFCLFHLAEASCDLVELYRCTVITLLRQSNPKNMVLNFSGVGKAVPTFADATAIADQLCLLNTQYDSIKILYNKFINATSYEPTIIEAFSEEAIKESANFSSFEIDEAVLPSLREYALANSLFWALAEGHACEQSARRNAMDNASKNAGEMINKFQILFNRTRQAVITGELVEIITGAAASEE